MKTKTYAMIDLETLGHVHNSAVIQIGCTVFTTDGILSTKEYTIDFEDALKYGVATASTLKWWMSQSREAINSVTNGTLGSIDAVILLTNFLSNYEIDGFFAHATFDFPIIENLIKAVGKRSPINFRLCRDIRTIEMLVGDNIIWEDREKTHHTAGADAEWQAKHMIKMLNELSTLGVNNV